MNKKIFLGAVIIILLGLFILWQKSSNQNIPHNVQQNTANTVPQNPLAISFMRQQNYPGSQIAIEQVLPDGNNYHQYIASYMSDGFTIYGLLTVPLSPPPSGGFPAILFNHGYIPPQTYQTNPVSGQYVTYLPVFADAGYVVFKPDYRGNGNSEGKPEGAYFSPAYTIDDLNAIASVKKLSYVNPNKIGVWGHSMGGNITLRDLVVEPSWIKVAVIWGGVVGSYTDLEHWHDPYYHPSGEEQAIRSSSRSAFFKKYGTPESNPTFWKTIDPTSFMSDITASVQLHVGSSDEEVPPAFSQDLYTKLKQNGKTVEFYSYDGADHNISQGFDLAMQRSLDFFNKYLKGGD